MLAQRWNQDGKVIVHSATTDEPISFIGEMAGICYGADTTNQEKNYRRGLDCIESNHGRTLEFPKIYLVLSHHSAKVFREWYTHIIDTTRLQASTRYIEYGDFNYITPPTIQVNEEAKKIYDDTINTIKGAIKKLEDMGIPKEDSSNLLPLCYESKVVCVIGLRELIAMSRVRMCQRAYWEYRELFNEIIGALRFYSDEWNYLITELKIFHPKCEDFGFCDEKFSCGRKPKKGVMNDV